MRSTFGNSPMDIAALRDLISGPGVDTRQWISYGTVNVDTADAHSVRFNDSDGNPLAQGVMVDVTLQPSGIVVPCRVGSQNAGSGEGEYSPFGPGDEVLVAVPEGDERAGCVIISRLSNVHDVWPTNVAGMDSTNNAMTFRRIKTAYVLETGSSYMVRQATTGANLTIDQTGNIFLGNGDGSLLSLHTSIITLQDPTGAALLQIDPSALTVALQADTTSLVLDASASTFQTSGTLDIGTAGVGAGGHAVTLEQVLNLLINWTYMLVGPTGSSTLNSELSAGGSILSPVTFPSLFDTAMSQMLTLAISPTPPLPGPGPAAVGGGNLTIFPLTFIAGINAALAAQLPDPASLGLPAPILPGIGKPALKF